MQPRGKQYWKPEPENIWYTPSSGIWQNAWLEVVPDMRIGDSSTGTFIRSDDIETGMVRATINVLNRKRNKEFVAVEMTAKFRGATIAWTESKKLSKESDRVKLEVDLRIEDKV